MNYKNIFRSKSDLQKVRKATQISNKILSQLVSSTKIGITPFEINEIAGKLCKENNVKPAFLGVKGPKQDFPGNLCVCVNDETLHAIPFSKNELVSGDIVKVDFGIISDEIFTDHCVTVALGQISEKEQALIDTTKLAVETASKQAIVNNNVGDISNVFESISNLSGYDFIRGYSGHGIGYTLWEDPSVPYNGEKGDGPKLLEGQLLSIEVQYSLGTGKLEMDKDGWTLRTKDGAKTAMFEQMVLVGKNAEILTPFEEILA